MLERDRDLERFVLAFFIHGYQSEFMRRRRLMHRVTWRARYAKKNGAPPFGTAPSKASSKLRIIPSEACPSP